MMGCCRNARQPYDKTVSLVFNREQLLYDIGNYAFVEGDVMPAKDEHERHPVMDVTEDGNVDLVTRTLNLAHTEVNEILYPYTKQDVEDGEELDDDLVEYDRYIVEMNVPKTFSRTSLQLLRNLVHDYMTARVLCEWMKITNLSNPKSAQHWEEATETLKSKMKNTIRWRGKPLRRSQHPF